MADTSLDWAEPDIPSAHGPTLIVYPTNSATSCYGYVYGYFIGVFVVVLIAIVIKITIKRKQLQARHAAAGQRRARQTNQLPTLSRSVDANGASTSESNDERIKADLPPTYEEIMKNKTFDLSPRRLSVIDIESGQPQIATQTEQRTV